MSVVRMRLVLIAALAVIAGIGLAAHGSAPEPSQAEQDRADARLEDARLARLPSPAPSIPAERASLIACLRGARFVVETRGPRTLVISGRGLAGTPVRIVGADGESGVDSNVPPGWGTVNNVAFGSLGAATAGTTAMRQAFFGCLDPHV